jgi:hypothetical protein
MRQKIVMMVKEGEIHIMCVAVTRNTFFNAVLDVEFNEEKTRSLPSAEKRDAKNIFAVKNCIFHYFLVKMTSIAKRIVVKGTLITTFMLIPNQGSRQALQGSLKKSDRPLI